MIIVSQDKDVIVNFNNVENIWINNPLENDDGKFEIRAESYSNNMLIGEYETEEKAKEVLQELADTYIGISSLENIVKDLTFDENTQVRIRPKVYYMPYEMPES